jgi:hypothetical protein
MTIRFFLPEHFQTKILLGLAILQCAFAVAQCNMAIMFASVCVKPNPQKL